MTMKNMTSYGLARILGGIADSGAIYRFDILKYTRITDEMIRIE
jgi:hypothetical protein